MVGRCAQGKRLAPNRAIPPSSRQGVRRGLQSRLMVDIVFLFLFNYQYVME